MEHSAGQDGFGDLLREVTLSATAVTVHDVEIDTRTVEDLERLNDPLG